MKRSDVIAIPPELAAKARLAGTGIYCFVACLGGAINLLALSALCEIIGGPIFAGIAHFMIAAGGLLFAGCFASFGLVIAGALKQPRDADLSPHLSSALPGIVLVFCAAMGAFALIVTGGAAWIVFSLYRETGVVIFLAIIYFLLASAFFALAVCYAIAWKAITRRGLPWPLRKVASRLAPGTTGGAGEDTHSRGIRILTRVDAILGSSIGIVFGLLIGNAGHGGAEETSGSPPSTSGWLLTGVTFFICIFATIMLLRGIRTLIDLKNETLIPGKGGG
ncbi:MAG: hypothetical protein JW838_12405 [Spirochaetes bacterium]|nr:hypothetical protein [Spirochaetota bacterium]